MSKTMLVALWIRDTFYKQGQTNENRMTRLAAAVERTAEIRRQIRSRRPWAKPEVIFMAPEYLFAKPTGKRWDPSDPMTRWVEAEGQEHHIDEAEKDHLKGELVTLSGKHPEMLIVPGTIAWSVRVKDHPDLLPAAEQRIGHLAGGNIGVNKNLPVQPPTGTAARLDRLHSLTGLAARGAGAAAGQPPLSAAERERLDKARLCLNTCFVLYGGQVVHVYGKQTDFYEVLTSARAGIAYEMAVPGDKPGVFDVEGHRFGIEICFDHVVGKLDALKPQPLPFIHLITSASAKVNLDHCDVEPGGYVVNAAALASLAGLWYRDPARPGPLVPIETPVKPLGVDGAERLRTSMPAPPDWGARAWPPISFKEIPDVAGSPLWLYRIDVP